MPPQENSIDDAVAAVARKDYERAESILTLLNDVPATRSLRSLFLYAQLLETQGRIAPAERLMDLASHLDTDDVEEAYFASEMATLIFRRRSHTSQDLELVAKYLKQSLSLGCHPNPDALLNNLCRVYFELGDYANLSKYAERLYSYPDHRIRAGLLLAHSCLRMHDSAGGNACLDGVLESLENVSEVDLPWFFELLIFFRRYADAQNVLDTLRVKRHPNAALDWPQAQVWFATHRIDDALTILTDRFCNSEVHDIKTRMKMHFMRGRCLDGTGNYIEAFEAFLAMNAMTRRLHGISRAPEFSANYETFDYAALPIHPEPQSMPFVPTFMIGFPRSGTTLLETVLDTQDEILTLSETQGIQQAIKVLRTWGMNYPQDLCLLSENQVQDLRSTYFDHNSHIYPHDKQYSLVIDKLPLNILHIPLILALFPSAKFLLSLRHPYDVCISCFQQTFEMNSEMAHFTNLEDTFKHYADVMNQFENFRSSLSFPLLIVRYEELVADFDEVVAKVFEFLGHEPTPGYKEFHLLADRKPVLTPSTLQVTRGVYTSSCERWRNYADEIEAFTPLVGEFVARYGYTT
jgi:tetratricopeptide (TPR) repeat protein